jgi:hypothetical protein
MCGSNLVTPRLSAATALRQLGEIHRLVARQPIWSPSGRRSDKSEIGDKRKCATALEMTLIEQTSRQ